MRSHAAATSTRRRLQHAACQRMIAPTAATAHVSHATRAVGMLAGSVSAVTPLLGMSPRRSLAYRSDPPQRADAKQQPAPPTPSPSPAHSLPSPQTLATTARIDDVLNYFHRDGRTFTCLASHSLYECVQIMVASRVGCLVAMEDDGEHVAGLVTERDILSELVRIESMSGVSWKTHPVSAAMTARREMIHIKPQDRIEDALTLMTSQGFRHLPVLDSAPDNHNTLRGIVSMRNLVDVVYQNRARGGKAQFLTDVLPRTGVPKNTSVRRKGVGAGAGGAGEAADAVPERMLYLDAGVSSRPHPDKKEGEDAWVCWLGHVGQPARQHPLSVLAVFDGVGSWSFEQGIDPARFSQTCAKAMAEFVTQHPSVVEGEGGPVSPRAPDQPPPPPISPAALLNVAWQGVSSGKIVGSSTACILSLAHDSPELRAANIGDSGFIILRHRDAWLGSMGAISPDGPMYQVIYRSPQQLHYFNCPLQLGIGLAAEQDKFESPADADILSQPVQEGDIIVLATDGLFDNVPEDRIVAELDASLKSLPDVDAKSAPESFCLTSSSPLTERAKQQSRFKPAADALVNLAYELSTDKMTDSPFAVLAKENNILWKSGGRKDDITVIVARVSAVPQPASQA